MNFFELTQQIAQNPETAADPSIDKNGYIRLASKIAQRLGEKSNTYTPLVRYVSKNPIMLNLLEQLIEETSLAQAGKLRNVVSKKY